FEAFAATRSEVDLVTGTVSRRVKGGLLVDVGVNAFLPASEVDARCPADLLQRRRERMRAELLSGLAVGQTRSGVVTNVVAYGAFLDLGGLDALLHLSEMSWGRVVDPHAVVRVGQQLGVKVLYIDWNAGKVAVSLKQMTPDPWSNAAAR